MTERLTFSLHFLFQSNLTGILKRKLGPTDTRAMQAQRDDCAQRQQVGGHLQAKERPRGKPPLLTPWSLTLDQVQEINFYCLSLLFLLCNLICGYSLWQPHSKNTEAWKMLSELCFVSDSIRGSLQALTSTHVGVTFKQCRQRSESVGEDFCLKDEYKFYYGLNRVPLKTYVEVLPPVPHNVTTLETEPIRDD